MKNKVQFQKGYSLFQIMKDYGTEEKCRKALFKWRWPKGYISMQSLSPSTLSDQHHYFRLNQTPSNDRFLAIHLLTQAKTGFSALALARQLGVCYNTAWNIKHKLMQVMKERDDSQPLSGIVQLDDVYWGGEYRGGKRGRGSPNKTPLIAAVSVDPQGHPITMNMNVIKGFRTSEVSRWAKQHLSDDAHVISDGLACFSAVKTAGCQHTPIVTGGGPECVTRKEFTWINTNIGNVKKSIHGAYHAIHPKHLPRYLAEFCYRFNRRFKLEDMLPRFVYVAARTSPMPVRLLILAEDYG